VVQTVNIRALKDRLSSYLQRVQHGDIVLISDRGRVVAELRSPTLSGAALDSVGQHLQQLVEAGTIRRGLPNTREAYHVADIELDADSVDAALVATRAERDAQ